MLCNAAAADDDDGDAKKNKRHRKLIRGLGIRRRAETKQKVGVEYINQCGRWKGKK